MAADKMSIAFLADNAVSETAPTSSSVSHRNTIARPGLPQRARIDSHQETTAKPLPLRTSTFPTRQISTVQLPERPFRANDRDWTSPSSTNDEPYDGTLRRQPRSPRPTYSEEQRFFVMYARLIQDKSWPDIEDDFATIFKQRSKGGLCSLYYRIRRLWGLEDVLKSDSNYWALERQVIHDKAYNFSRDFLMSIGYLRQQ